MDTANTQYRGQPRERSLFALFSDLWRETSTLVHEEAELAKAEMSEKVSQIGTGAMELAVGTLVAFAGFIILLIAASNALGHFLPEEQADWLAPLIIGLLVVGFGVTAVLLGKRNMKAQNLAPERTMESMGRDARMMKEHAS